MTQHRSVVSRFVGLALALLLLAPPATWAGPLRRLPQHESFDGKTLFRGLFFRSGPVADIVPELWGGMPMTLSPEQQLEIERFFDRLIARVEEDLDSSFFDRFGLEVQSGDHLRIHYALREGTDLVLQALEGELGELGFVVHDPEGLAYLDDSKLENGGEKAIAVATVVSVVAFIAGVAAVNVFYFFNVDTTVNIRKFSPLPRSTTPTTLQRDMWIDLFAERLQVRNTGDR